jgi:Flp pilus assembly protein TadD
MRGLRRFSHSAVMAVLCSGWLSGCVQSTQSPDAPASQNGVAVMNVADAAIASGNPDMALKISQSVLADSPNNLDALYHEAAAYYAVGRCEDAIAAYKVALGIDPRSSDAETGIGRCLLKHNAAGAEQAFDAAVQYNPNNAAALNDLGVARDLQGNYAGATKPYEESLLVQPGVLSTEVNLGLSLALSGDAGDALNYLGPLATGTAATPKVREDYAIALIAAGRTDEARQVLAIDMTSDQIEQLISNVTPLMGGPPPLMPNTPDAPPATPAPAYAPVVNTPPVTTAPLPAAAPVPATVPAAPGMDDVIVR